MLLIAGSVVQTLTRSLERQLSTPIKKPVGGTRVMPPSSPSPRPAIVKQRAVKKINTHSHISQVISIAVQILQQKYNLFLNIHFSIRLKSFVMSSSCLMRRVTWSRPP